jgi:hypothetical protein
MTRLQGAIAVFLFACTIAPSQARGKPASASSEPSGAQKRQGFLDYALGKINPDNKDYGAAGYSLREQAVHNSIASLYFWSNLLSLGLLTTVTVVHLLDRRSAERKELICAAIIAQLWNGRVSDLVEIERRTNQYNTLAERHNREVEKDLSANVPALPAASDSSSTIKQTVEKLERRSGVPKSTEPREAPTEKVAKVALAHPSGSVAADLQQGTLLLERQIEAMRNTEQNLKERLNQATFELERERQRNATLKGA